MARLAAGVLLVDIDGTIVEIEGGFSIMPNTTKREAVVSQSGKVLYKTTPTAAGFKGTLLVTQEVTGAWLLSIVEKGCTVRLRDGRQFAFSECTSTGEYEHDGVEGTVPVEFFAQSCTETVA